MAAARSVLGERALVLTLVGVGILPSLPYDPARIPPLVAETSEQCPGASLPGRRDADLLFTVEQETELGGFIKAQLELSTRVINDPSVTGYLRQTGDRLVARLPAGGPPYRFFLADLADANALSLPGGWVLVSRKMVGTLRSEDELAAVLAHEIGHVATGHGALALSRAFKDVLGIDRVEPTELFERYQDLIESSQTTGGASEDDEDQAVADGVAAQLLASAGYDPRALTSLFERFAQLGARKGNWFTDLLGSTPPNAKRVRAIAAEAAGLSRCVSAAPGPAGSFQDWQNAVLHYRGIGSRESLPGLVRRTTLQPPLRADVSAIRISGDGQYVLAQDESSIAIISRDGLRTLFQVDAEGARIASFSHDSRRVSFLTHSFLGSPRVEWWSLRDRTADVHEVHVADGCVQSALAPDGTALICVTIGRNYNDNSTFDLRIIDVETERVVLERRPFVTIGRGDFLDRALGGLGAGDVEIVGVSFSPDSRYVVLGNEAVTAGFDLSQRKPVELSAGVKRLARGVFAFMDDRRVVGRVGSELQIVSFPDGATLLDGVSIGIAAPRPTANGDYLLVGPLKGDLAGVLDVRKRSLIATFPRRAADVFAEFYVREREDGRLAMHRLGEGADVASAAMPASRLVSLRAGAVSPDGRWLAASGRTRAGVWDLDNEQRVLHLRPFETAWLGEPGALTAVVRERNEPKHSLVRFDLLKPPALTARETEKGTWWLHGGPVVLSARPANPAEPRRDVTLGARDIGTNASLWTRRLTRDAPYRQIEAASGSVVLVWPLADDDIRPSVQRDAAWQEVLRGVKDLKRLVCFEVIDAATGATRGRVAVDARMTSLAYARAVATADRLFVLEARGRLIAYSFDGRVRGRTFAAGLTVSPDGRHLAIRTAAGRLQILDALTFKPLEELQFADTIALVSFVPDAERLIVLTSDQRVHTLSLGPDAR